jgi:hypothetical protein
MSQEQVTVSPIRTVTIPVLSAMRGSCSLILYTSSRVDVLRFDVLPSCALKVLSHVHSVVHECRMQVTTPTNASQPGTPVDFRIEGTPNALVAISAVDARLSYVESSVAKSVTTDNAAPMWLWMAYAQTQDSVRLRIYL